MIFLRDNKIDIRKLEHKMCQRDYPCMIPFQIEGNTFNCISNHLKLNKIYLRNSLIERNSGIFNTTIACLKYKE